MPIHLLFRLAKQDATGQAHTLPEEIRPGVAARIATVSSPLARQAHNLKVVSSNLAPATNFHLF